MNQKIVFIGGGNMASSLIGGLLQKGWPAALLYVADPDKAQLEKLERKYGIKTLSDNAMACQKADVLVLAVKPQIMAHLAKELHPILSYHSPLIVSVAAGINTHFFDKKMGNNLAVVRAMPNTPALVGQGAMGLFANPQVTEAHKRLVDEMMSSVGMARWVEDESLMNAITALSGSGPAYFFYIMEVLQKTAVKLGLPDDLAQDLSIQTALGASTLAKQSSDTPADLRKQVTSPGGTTEAALQRLISDDLEQTFLEALTAAEKRGESLEKMAEND